MSQQHWSSHGRCVGAIAIVPSCVWEVCHLNLTCIVWRTEEAFLGSTQSVVKYRHLEIP